MMKSGYLKRLREDCANLIDCLRHYIQIGDLERASLKGDEVIERIQAAQVEKKTAEIMARDFPPFGLPHMQRRS